MQYKSFEKSKILIASLLLLGFSVISYYSVGMLNERSKDDLGIFYTTTGSNLVQVQLASSGSLDMTVGETRDITLKVSQGSSDALNGMIFSVAVPSSFKVTGVTAENGVTDNNRETGFVLNKSGLEGYVFSQVTSGVTHIRLAAASTTPSSFTLNTNDEILKFTVEALTPTTNSTANISFDLETTNKSYPAIVKTGTGTLADLDVLSSSLNSLNFNISEVGCNPSTAIEFADVYDAVASLFDAQYYSDLKTSNPTAAERLDRDCDGTITLLGDVLEVITIYFN